VVLHDLSPAFLLLAKIWMGVRSVCGDAAALPFRKGAFGTVVCSEVVEHVERPVPVFLELSRVARETVLVSTEQCCPWRWEYSLRMATADRRSFHSDRNWYLPGHFVTLMGPGTMLSASQASPRRTHGRKIEQVQDLAGVLKELSCEQPYSPAAGGILAVRGLNDARVSSDKVLVDRVIDQDREADAGFLDAARKTLRIMSGEEPPPDGPFPADVLCCPGPDCRGSLRREDPSGLACGRCGARHEVRWGIPVLDPTGNGAIEHMLEGVASERAEEIRALARTLERGGRVQWAAPLSWALLGALGFLRLRVGMGERTRILYGWARDALIGTRDPGAEK